jgi:hypothetical protein
MAAIKLIREDAGGKKGAAGTVKCPECGGKLRYSIAETNGHIRAVCETADCISFMQ